MAIPDILSLLHVDLVDRYLLDVAAVRKLGRVLFAIFCTELVASLIL